VPTAIRRACVDANLPRMRGVEDQGGCDVPLLSRPVRSAAVISGCWNRLEMFKLRSRRSGGRSRTLYREIKLVKRGWARKTAFEAGTDSRSLRHRISDADPGPRRSPHSWSSRRSAGRSSRRAAGRPLPEDKVASPPRTTRLGDERNSRLVRRDEDQAPACYWPEPPKIAAGDVQVIDPRAALGTPWRERR